MFFAKADDAAGKHQRCIAILRHFVDPGEMDLRALYLKISS